HLALLLPIRRRESQLPNSRQRGRRGIVRSRPRLTYESWPSAECPAGSMRVRLPHRSGICRIDAGQLRHNCAHGEVSRTSLELVQHADPGTTEPASVSSVDSGNLAASLYTLRMGALFLLREPLISRRLFEGFETYWQLLKLHIPELDRKGAFAPPSEDADFDTWIAWLLENEETLLTEIDATESEAKWWVAEVRQRVSALTTVLREYLPWLLPEFKPLREIAQIGLREETIFPPLNTAADFAEQL